MTTFAEQIIVPHNETTKVDRGGLDKMTLTEVGIIMLLFLIQASFNGLVSLIALFLIE